VVCLEDGDKVLGELRRCGYLPRCESASNGAGAAGDEVAAPNSPTSAGASGVSIAGAFRRVDVILMDIMMRRTNGVDVAVELRQMFRDAASAASAAAPAARPEWCRLPPIVAMTGNTSLQNIETYKRAGFCHVLPKPFDVGGVQSALSVCSGGV
jgi:CheY-like chemotaxis protein